jgi:general secretion pathway protein J
MRTRGFTLIELLVAITIFALIGLASYRVLSSVMMTDERLAARTEQLRQVNRAFWWLQQDVEQLVDRDVRNADGGVSATRNYLLINNAAELPLQFTRGGRANPLGLQRSSMQRIAYAVDHHPDYDKPDSPHYREERRYLLRYSWSMLDGAGAKEKAQVQVVLQDIDKMAVGVLTAHGVEPQWPAQNMKDPPLALQFAFTLPEGSIVNRSYKVF